MSVTKVKSVSLQGALPAAVLAAVSLFAVVSLAPESMAQQVKLEPIPVKNWAVPKSSGRELSGVSNPNTSPPDLVFVAITPCRVVDTRAGSAQTGQFGAPELVASQARTFLISQSSCGVPTSAAYSLNFVSITAVGQPVNWIAAWPDDQSFPGTVVLNASQGGIIDNSAIVSAGTDGGIQVMATNNTNLVIDMNGYFVQASTIQGPVGRLDRRDRRDRRALRVRKGFKVRRGPPVLLARPVPQARLGLKARRDQPAQLDQPV